MAFRDSTKDTPIFELRKWLIRDKFEPMMSIVQIEENVETAMEAVITVLSNVMMKPGDLLHRLSLDPSDPLTLVYFFKIQKRWRESQTKDL